MNIFTNLVTGDKFFGRERELKFLYKKVEDLKKGYRHNVAILGRRMSGKSSLLLHLLSIIDKADLVPVYLDMALLAFNGFVDQFIGMLLYSYKEAKDDIECDLSSLINGVAAILPKTHQKIKTIYSYLKTGREKMALEELFDLPACFSNESGRFCLIVLDNFSKLTDYNLADPFSVLGEKIMLQKDILYILSDYPDINSKNILSEKLSLLFGKFQVIELESFTPEESILFINSRIKDTILTAEFKKFLVHFCGGEPFYLDLITERIAEKASEKKLPIFSDEELYHIIYECIFEKYSPLNQYFSMAVEKCSGPDSPRETAKILNAVLRNNKVQDIAQDSNCQKKQMHKLLERFIAQDVVIKNGLLYAIEDEIFKMWLRFKELELAPYFRLDRLDQKIYTGKFIDEVKRLFESFVKEQQKAVDNKILNLITTFNNEKVTVGKGTHILPTFKHIHTEAVTEENVILSAHGTKMWIFSISKQLADEDNIFDFINYCKKQKHKVSRKVLIILNGITPEAKLLAMQERIWIWPLDKLNSLLNLYRKPKIAMAQ